MFENIDKEVLIGFVEEAKSYLPAIRRGLEAYQADNRSIDGLEEVYRHVHTIKGASAMVGLTSLSQMAHCVEEATEQIGAGQLILNEAIMSWLTQAIDSLEIYLDGVLNDTLDEQSLLDQVTQSYQRLQDGTTETVAISEAQQTVTAEPSNEVVYFDDEFMAELMTGFSLEAEDHLRLISLSLADLSKNYEDRESLQKVRRSVHTLKGAAATVGLQMLAELSHRMEDLLDDLYDGKRTLNSQLLELLFTSADTLEDLTTGDLDQVALDKTIQALYDRYDAILKNTPHRAASSMVVSPPKEPQLTGLPTASLQLTKDDESQWESAPTLSPRDEGGRRDSSEVVRVPIERLDELIRLVGELVITRTSFEQRMGDLIREVGELKPSINRLRRISVKLETDYEVSTLGGGFGRVGRQPEGKTAKNGDMVVASSNPAYATGQAQEFDELEFDRYTEFHLLSRELSETTSDVNSIGQAMDTLISDFDGILTRQSRLSSELQEKLMRTRMVPLTMLSTRLNRTVRVVAQKRAKQVDLVIEGENIELDKTVLEEMSDPLLHLLRNAVDHGIEPAPVRQAKGKPERGLIHLQAYHEGNQVVIKISDDGTGLDPDLIRAKAISNGYISETEAYHLSEQDLYNLIFMPGFSTAGQISDVSGRGVGLDVVRANVAKLKGTVDLKSTLGQGASFIVRLPMTLAVTRALLIETHGEIFAIPLNTVNQILRLERQEFERIGQEPIVRIAGKVYPLLHLGDVLNLKQPADETIQRLPVLIINAEGKEIAVVVDHIIRGREIVIKNLGNHLRKVHGIMGATLMGDGQVVLILNPVELLSQPTKTEQPSWTPQITPLHDVWNIMVVDDSVSVRRIVSTLIKNAGWQPTIAKDGLEALEMIQHSTQPPNLILLDVEMPRMDGYELAATLRSQDAYKDVPIVMLTSRAGEKHRRKAFEVGVTDYLVKPYQDEVLLGTIRQLVRGGNRAEVA